MMKKQGSVWGALKEGAKVVTAGRSFLDEAKFSLHVLTEGRIQAAADDDLERARKIALSHGATETENTIPKIIRANPFGPLNGMLGPEGERWAPVHGFLPHSRAEACYDAVEALFASYREEMDRLGMFTGTLLASVGGSGCGYRAMHILARCVQSSPCRIDGTFAFRQIARVGQQ